MSPFRALSTKDLTRGMKKSAMKTRVSFPFGPDPSSLAEVTSADDFRAIKGSEDGIPLNQLDNLPNCFILHPAVFLDHLYPNAVEASTLAAQIVNSTFGNNSRGQRKLDDSTKILGSTRLLNFLWGVENNFLSPIALEDIPDSEEVHKRCNEILTSLLEWNWKKILKDYQTEIPVEKSPGERSTPFHQPEEESIDMSSDEGSKPDVPVGRNIASFPVDPVRTRGKLKDPNAYIPREEENESGRTTTGSSPARTHWETSIRSDRSQSSSAQKRDRFLPSDSSLEMGREQTARSFAMLPPLPQGRRTRERDNNPDRGSPSSSSSSPSRSTDRGRENRGRGGQSRSESSSRSPTRRNDRDDHNDRNRRRSRSPNDRNRDRSGRDGSRSRSYSRSRSRSPRRHDRAGRDRKGRSHRRNRDDRRSNRDRRIGQNNSPSAAQAFQAAMASSFAFFSDTQMENREREERKKSMLYRMSPEQASLFKLVSARNWSDRSPKLNKFTTKLIEDKDSSKAIATIASETRGWAGQVSPSQLIAFLSGGYAARDITKQPGGFTAFMCHPRSAKVARNPEEDRNAIRSMFGDKTLDDDTVKFF
jgi:hypothetical protein